MVFAGNTYTTIANNLFARFNIKWLQQPRWLALLLEFFSILWIIMVASKARHYWTSCVPNFDYIIWDSYWFSYISQLTV